MSHARASDLTDKLNHALRKERWTSAFELYEELSALELDEPRWPNRAGDLHRRLGHDAEAVRCYERAVDRYAKQGFVARAAAMAKVLLAIDPTRTDVLARVDPTRARELLEQRRRAGAGASASPRNSMADAPLLVGEGASDVEGFSSLAPDEVMELDLSDAEILGRVAPPRPAPRDASTDSRESEWPEIEATELEDQDEDEPEADWDVVLFVDDEAGPSAEELATLPSSPLFADVPQAALDELLLSAELLEVAPSERIVRFGEPADALLVITEGSAEVHVPGLEGGAPILLGEGDVVGESCLLDNVTRGADVVARSRTRALSLPKTTLDRLVLEYPEVGQVLTELLGRRLLGNLLATSELFAAFDPESKRALSRLFEVRRAEEETELLARGKPSDGLYVVLAGQLGVRDEAGDEGVLTPGEIIGERSLLDHAPSEVDCWAITDVLLLRLPRARFVELVASYPPVLASLAELAARDSVLGSNRVV